MNSPAAIPAGTASASQEVRAQFEAWDKEQFWCAPVHYGTTNGLYLDRPIQCRWEAWQAATALSAARIRDLEEALEEILSIDIVAPEGGHEEVREIHSIARSTLKKD